MPFAAGSCWSGFVVGLTLVLIPVPNMLVTYLFPIWVAAISAMLLVRRDEIRAAS